MAKVGHFQNMGPNEVFVNDEQLEREKAQRIKIGQELKEKRINLNKTLEEIADYIGEEGISGRLLHQLEAGQTANDVLRENVVAWVECLNSYGAELTPESYFDRVPGVKSKRHISQESQITSNETHHWRIIDVIIMPVVVALITVAVGAWFDATYNEGRIINAISVTIYQLINNQPNSPGPEQPSPRDVNGPPNVMSGQRQDDDEPEPTPEQPEDREVAIEETFDEPGAYTNYNWELFTSSDDCDISAGTGTLIFANELSDEGIHCNLAIAADSLPWHQIGTIEAQLKIISHNGEEFNHGIGLYSSDIMGEWGVLCGINAESDGPQAVFTGKKLENGLPTTFFDDELDTVAASKYLLDFDEYYDFRLEIDYDTDTLRCFVDNQLLGELSAEEVPGLLDAAIDRGINSYRSAGAVGVTELEEVRILE